MSTKRKRYSAALQAKAAVEAIRDLQITAGLASEHRAHPTLISQWKRQALENVASLFEGGIAPVGAHLIGSIERGICIKGARRLSATLR